MQDENNEKINFEDNIIDDDNRLSNKTSNDIDYVEEVNISTENIVSEENSHTKKSKSKKRIKIYLSLILILFLMVISAGGTFYLLDRFGFIKLYKNVNIEQVKKLELDQYSKQDNSTKAVAKIVENVMPSIVSIAAERYKFDYFNQPTRQVGNGTGFIIQDNEDSLYIATNNHVIGNSQKIVVTFVDNSTVSASVIGKEKEEDLALIAVKKEDINANTLNVIKTAVIGKSSELKIGEDVIAIGNALGYGQSVTKGIVSALNRGQNIGDNFLPLIQTDTAINPGNSGGPLVNMEGQVVGINTVKLASSEIEGIGYAIPSDIFVPELENIKNGDSSTKASLGVRGKFVDEQVASAYDLSVGLYVVDIESQALIDAGLKKGDIITKINREDVISIKNIQRLLRKYRVGDVVELTIYRRSGETTNIRAKLGERKSENN